MVALATYRPSTRQERRMSAYDGAAYDVLNAAGEVIGDILKSHPRVGGYRVNVTLDSYALADDAGGDIQVPNLKTAKLVVERFLAAPSSFVAPEPSAAFDLDALFALA